MLLGRLPRHRLQRSALGVQAAAMVFLDTATIGNLSTASCTIHHFVQVSAKSASPDVDGVEEAIPVLVLYAKNANWLANIMAASLKPYYDASYDDRKGFTKTKELAPIERLSNEYKVKRNVAFAMHGECLLKIGDKKGAMPVLMKALDLIDIDNEAWWKRSRENLLSIIEVEP